MPTLEVPLYEAPENVDLYYENRHQLAAEAWLPQSTISTLPRIIGSLADREGFSQRHRSDVPKLPIGFSLDGEGRLKQVDISLTFTVDSEARLAEYDVPEGLKQFHEAIRLAAAYEHSVYPGATYAHGNEAFLSIDQRPIEPGYPQRPNLLGKALHRDGSSFEWTHFYVVNDTEPTEFFEFQAPRSEGQADEAVTRDLIGPFRPGEYAIAFANSTSLHQSPRSVAGGARTFFRLSYVHLIEEAKS